MLSKKEAETLESLLRFASTTPFVPFKFLSGQLTTCISSGQESLNFVLITCHFIQVLALLVLAPGILETENTFYIMLSTILGICVGGGFLIKLSFFKHSSEYVALVTMMLKFDNIQGTTDFDFWNGVRNLLLLYLKLK